MYNIKIDKSSELVEVELAGFMSVDEVAEYISALKRQFVINRLRRYVMVIDVTNCPIQSQEMTRAMGEHMATMPKAEALAVVVGSSLARMQVRRLFTQPYARTTANVAEARSWVLHGIEPVTK